MDLGQEALRADVRGDIGVQHLDRDTPVMAIVVSEVDGRHSAGAELALEAVLSGEGGGDT
jgi:hypothetical protein